MSDKCKTFVARWDHAMCSTCGEEHNRPAPTPTPAPGLDLDAVERAERAMTPGPWRHGSVERHHVFCSEGDRSLLCPEAGRVLLRMNEHFPHDSNAAGIVALRNAAPALIAEVRALRAAAEEREADMHARIRAGYDRTVADAWRAEVAKRDAEIARLTAELAAARAVPGDVEAAIRGLIVCTDLMDNAAQVTAARDALRTAIARAISDARRAGFAAASEDRMSVHDALGVSPQEAARAAMAHGVPCPTCGAEDATAARGTVGGLLATAPNLSDDEGQYVANRIGLTYELSTDAGRGRAIKAMRAAEEIIARGPLPKGG